MEDNYRHQYNFEVNPEIVYRILSAFWEDKDQQTPTYQTVIQKRILYNAQTNWGALKNATFYLKNMQFVEVLYDNDNKKEKGVEVYRKYKILDKGIIAFRLLHLFFKQYSPVFQRLPDLRGYRTKRTARGTKGKLIQSMLSS